MTRYVFVCERPETVHVSGVQIVYRDVPVPEQIMSMNILPVKRASWCADRTIKESLRIGVRNL